MSHTNSLEAALSADQLLAQLVEEITGKLQAGEAVSLSDYEQQYPEQADRLRRLWPTIEELARLGSLPAGKAPIFAPTDDEGQSLSTGTLGDFRILREVGRGGMGVVYEAEQFSLCRRVALKVLPFAATMDPRHLQRFQNEARAAASLDHPHIVDVYGVGCERGVHYYAMRLIEGHTLAEIVAQLRQLQENDTPMPDSVSAAAGANEQASSTPEQPTEAYSPPPYHVVNKATDTRLEIQTILPTKKSSFGPVYFQSIAELGMHVAEALDSAHEQGIIHRDIKPSNLMLDGRGKVWVTDFGLAHIETGGTLTMTGDLVGTLRYMSPEQALAKRVSIDNRTDIYSLGATLYELLTLQPTFGGNDRQELLRQISFEEPKAPRKINRAIPAELETIVLKAMEKNAADRYATAGEMAEDLGRFLEHKPIKAKRTSLLHKGRKWVRRHLALAWSLVACLLVGLTVLAGSIGWMMRDRAGRQSRLAGQVELILRDVDNLLAEHKLPEALAAAKRAEAAVQSGEANAVTRQFVHQTLADLKLLRLLERVRLRESQMVKGRVDRHGAERAYMSAFAGAGLTIEDVTVQQAAQQLGTRTAIQVELATALTSWARLRRRIKKGANDTSWQHLLAVADAIDADPWRRNLRKLWKMDKGGERLLRELADSADVGKLSPFSIWFLAKLVEDRVSYDEAAKLLLKARRQHPADFWINSALGWALGRTEPKRLEEAVGFYRVAQSLRPDDPAVVNSLGATLGDQGNLDEASMCYRKAIELDSEFALAHRNLAFILRLQGKLDAALTQFQRVIELDPGDSVAHNGLGVVFAEQNKPDAAIAYFRKAIKLNPANIDAHSNLGKTLRLSGNLHAAAACFREIIELEPKDFKAHVSLGNVFSDQKKFDDAMACYRKAIELNPKCARAYYNLGYVLSEQMKLDDAIACYRKAIELRPEYARAHYNLGLILEERGRSADAIVCYRKAIASDPRHVNAYYNLGDALLREKKLDEAIVCYRKAIELNPKMVAVHNNLGLALMQQKKLDEAVACFRRELELQPKYGTAHFNLGLALEMQGRIAKAIASYRKAIEFAPELTYTHNHLAWMLCTTTDRTLQEPAEAVMHAKCAVRLAPTVGAYWNTLGVAHYRAGAPKAAIAALEKSIQLRKGGDGEDWLFLAMSHWQLNNKDQARMWYAKAVSWMEKNASDNENLRRFRAEAEEVMGINGSKNGKSKK